METIYVFLATLFISAAPGDQGFLVSWTDFGADCKLSNLDVYAQVIDANGRPVGSEIAVSQAPGVQLAPMVGFDGDKYLVVWSNVGIFDPDTQSLQCLPGEPCMDIYGGLISKTGTPIAGTAQGHAFPLVLGPAADGATPLAFGGGRYLIAWNNMAWSSVTRVIKEWQDWTALKVVADVYGAFLEP